MDVHHTGEKVEINSFISLWDLYLCHNPEPVYTEQFVRKLWKLYFSFY